MTPSIHHRHHLSAPEQHAQLVKQTQKWVAQTFFGTLLKQMRNDPFKNEMFDGGRGGEAFGEMYDQQLADRMSKAAGKPLVDGIVRKIEAAKAYGRASKLAGKGSHPGDARPGADAGALDNPDRAARISAAASVADAATVADAVTRNRR
jgi:Rod binding domain-containing protein